MTDVIKTNPNQELTFHPVANIPLVGTVYSIYKTWEAFQCSKSQAPLTTQKQWQAITSSNCGRWLSLGITAFLSYGAVLVCLGLSAWPLALFIGLGILAAWLLLELVNAGVYSHVHKSLNPGAGHFSCVGSHFPMPKAD